MKTHQGLFLALSLWGCSPLTGSWSGLCEANGSWSLELQHLTPSGDALADAEEPGQWSAVRGTATISPALNDIQSGEVTLYHCGEHQAPCAYRSGSLVTEAEAGFIQGEILDPVDGSTIAMRFFGHLVDDDQEIEGSCYNLVAGGSGSLRLDR